MALPRAILLASLTSLGAAATPAKIMSDGRAALSAGALAAALPEDLAPIPLLCTATAPLPGLSQLLNRALGCDLPEASTFREVDGLELVLDAGERGVAMAGHPGFRGPDEALSAPEAALARIAAGCADGCVLDVMADDLEGSSPPLAEVLKALMEGAKPTASSGKPLLIVLVRGAEEGQAKALDAWLARSGLEAARERFAVKALGISTQPTIADADVLWECVEEFCRPGEAGAEAVSAKILAACEAAGAGASIARPGFEAVQAMGVYAAAKASAELEAGLDPYRAQCVNGKVVKNFGSIVASLRERCLKKYISTVSALTAKMPVPPEGALEAAFANGKATFDADMDTSIRRLEARQLLTLATIAEKDLQKNLLRELRAEGALPRDRQGALVRQVLFDFAARAKPVLSEGTEIYEESYEALEERLTQLAGRYMETPKAQLVTQTRVEKKAKRQRAGPGERSIKARLDFVSMLNFMGAGGLEGFGSYQAGLMNLIVGFQNANEGDEPFLMIQPKLHFDVSL